jgi:NAD(P)H dehydrogenase (quinone)
MMNIYVVFYSENGHVYRLAQAIAEGARSVDGASVKIFQTERLSTNPESGGAGDATARSAFAGIPIIAPWELSGADAVIFGTPAKLGMMAAPMRNLLDQAGPLWADGALLGKVGSVFTSTDTRQGGQESTVTSFHVTLLHLGMIIVGVPYWAKRQLPAGAISGVNPYGVTMMVEAVDDRKPREHEIGIARFQGQHVAEIARALSLGRDHMATREQDRSTQ